MRIKANALGIIVLFVIFGGIVTATAFNMWHTSSTKEPAKYTSGEFKGQYDPSDIRGSYTFGDINNSFDVPVEVLAKAFGVEDYKELSGFQLKNLEKIYEALKNQGKEIGTGSVKIFIALYKNLPIDFSEGDYLPKPAVDILMEKGTLTEKQVSLVKANSVDIAGITGQQSAQASSKTETEHTVEERLVKGKTTFEEVITWGIKKEKVEEIIGGKIPAPGMTISDYCRQKGLAFSTIKDKLNSLIQ